MSVGSAKFENASANMLSAVRSSTSREKIHFYNSWAKSYDTDSAVLHYHPPTIAANIISSHFSGDREAAVVLDVACGTGLVAKQLKTHGFRHFVGLDGSERMLELCREDGLYQELKQVMLGDNPLPVSYGVFDVVVIVGALSVGHVPVKVVRQLCKSAKPGGTICMTVRNTRNNDEYKASLEQELKKMEEEGLWTCAKVSEVKDWQKQEHEDGYVPGVAYLYKKL